MLVLSPVLTRFGDEINEPELGLVPYQAEHGCRG
jgi:hypothetical protein